MTNRWGRCWGALQQNGYTHKSASTEAAKLEYCAVELVDMWEFQVKLQGHRVSWSYWQSQRREKGDTAGLMVDSSRLWSTLHSVPQRIFSEMKVELILRGKSKVKLRGSREFWWRHPFDRAIVPPLFPFMACHSRFHFLSACLPASPACRSLSLLIQLLFVLVGWQTRHTKKIMHMWVDFLCHKHTNGCLSHCLCVTVILFNSLRWLAHFTTLTDLACQEEKHYTAAPCHAGRYYPFSGFNFSVKYNRQQSALRYGEKPRLP